MLTVSELVAGLRELLERRLGRVWVAGEISNLHRAASGHVYLTLKDEAAQLRAAVFRPTLRRLRFELEDGLEVLVEAQVTVYAPRGDLQLRVHGVEPRGQGALQLAFEQLRARLEREGLFDAALKRPLPAIPARLGVVTSPTGAALRDVLEVTGQRFPATPILIAPTRVQGEGAEEEIAAALEACARAPDVDLILLVRGGGSLEDLWCFNSERVARALRACPVPVVSGVGHEVDVTIADLAADARAATPSAAAARALPDRAALATRIDRDTRRLGAAARRRLEQAGERLRRARLVLRAHSPAARLAARGARLAAAARGLERAAAAALAAASSRLARLAARLDALSPLAVLGRGFALVQRPDGAVVRAASQVAVGDPLRIRLAQGRLDASVTARRNDADDGTS